MSDDVRQGAGPQRVRMNLGLRFFIQDDRHPGDFSHEVRFQTAGFTHNFNPVKVLQNLFPDCSQLHFSQSITHATMHAEAERNMIASAFTIYDEFIGSVNF